MNAAWLQYGGWKGIFTWAFRLFYQPVSNKNHRMLARPHPTTINTAASSAPARTGPTVSPQPWSLQAAALSWMAAGMHPPTEVREHVWKAGRLPTAQNGISRGACPAPRGSRCAALRPSCSGRHPQTCPNNSRRKNKLCGSWLATGSPLKQEKLMLK